MEGPWWNLHGFDAALDRPYEGEMPSPDFSESQMWNFSDGRYGVMYHLGAMPGDMKLWQNVLSINCPDGSVLVGKVVGRGEPDMFGAISMHSRTIEPYRRWRIHFDGAMRRHRSEDLWTGPGRDGAHVPVRIELDVRATHSVWEPAPHGSGPDGGIFNTMARMHHEQPLAVTGRLIIDGETVEYEAIGHRDHSYGPRDMRKLRRDAWINATFESGWAFLGFWGELDDMSAERSAIFEKGRILEGSMRLEGLRASVLTSPAPEPRQFEVVVAVDGGGERTLKVRCTQNINWFSAGPMEWCVGADLNTPDQYNWSMAFADFECDGERGLGFVDRGASASLMTPR
jgi:hypothetical protein